MDRSSLSFDVVFIGDSFNEGMGLPYEDTFVGMYDLAHPSLEVANLGVRGYSPTRYLEKISYYLDRGLKTKHVIVFIDISDMQDEVIVHRYESYLFPKTSKLIRKHLIFTSEIVEGIAWRIIPCLVGNNFTFQCILSPYRGRFSWADASNNAKIFEPLGISGAIERSLLKMERLWGLLNKHGIKLSIGVYPWFGNLKHGDENDLQVKTWKKFCEYRCFSFINTYPTWFTLKEKLGIGNVIKRYSLWPKDKVHFNKNGNQVIFEVFNKEFKFDEAS